MKEALLIESEDAHALLMTKHVLYCRAGNIELVIRYLSAVLQPLAQVEGS